MDVSSQESKYPSPAPFSAALSSCRSVGLWLTHISLADGHFDANVRETALILLLCYTDDCLLDFVGLEVSHAKFGVGWRTAFTLGGNEDRSQNHFCG